MTKAKDLKWVLKILKEWSSEDPDDSLCRSLHQMGDNCRHDRARAAIIQIENAQDELVRRSRRSSEKDSK